MLKLLLAHRQEVNSLIAANTLPSYQYRNVSLSLNSSPENALSTNAVPRIDFWPYPDLKYARPPCRTASVSCHSRRVTTAAILGLGIEAIGLSGFQYSKLRC